MKSSQAVTFCLQYQQENSRPSTLKHYEFMLSRFLTAFRDRELHSIKSDETLAFLTEVTAGTKTSTKRNRYGTLKAFFNLINTALEPELINPCNHPMLVKIFKRPKISPYNIFDKDIIDEVIFRTTKLRNRIMLELMARGGMRISEVLNIRPSDIEDRKIFLRQPKSGKEREVVFVPQKLSNRLNAYIKDKGIKSDARVFPISYVAARRAVVNAGNLLDIHLRPHDLRRHAATYASRAGVPIEIISKVILRHSDLSTTQRYLGKVSDTEAIRWIENIHG